MAIRPEPGATTHHRGTLAEMVAALHKRVQELYHDDQPDQAEEARAAARGLQAGSFSVRVGTATYSVDAG